MKAIRSIFFVFTILTAAVACNNQHEKRAEEIITVTERLPVDSPIVKQIQKHKAILYNPLPCKYIVTEILTTSPRYRQLTKGLNEAIVKNGGLSFGVSLEGSPNPKLDTVSLYSKNYDFTVYESYTDRRLNTARFSFNPENKQLYEYDAVDDQLKPIEFDRSLLEKYKSLCK